MSSLHRSVIEELGSRHAGEVIAAGQPGYDEARAVWNGYFDRRPDAIVRPKDAAGVEAAVQVARAHDALLAVKGGGHNSAGNGVSDGGLTIDLSGMREVSVDPATRRVRVQGGALLSDVDRATNAHGLAVSAGIVSHTGVGGLTLGGGFGWISRSQGLSVDNLVGASVVTAEGTAVRASASENADLFWALRGGGGNFGVVTSFEFDAAPIGREVYSGIIAKRFEDVPSYMAFHREFVRGLPDEMTLWMVMRKAPPLPFLPAEVHGSRVLLLPFVYVGDAAKGEALIQPVREQGATLGEFIGLTPWPAWQSMFDPLVTHGARNYWKSHHLTDLAPACVDQLIAAVEQLPSDECELFIPHMEGAPSRVAPTATAYGHRTVPFLLNIHTRWRDPADDAKCLAWVRGLHDATRPFAQGVYVNFVSDEGPSRVKEAYPAEVWNRLVDVKGRWDPTNLFRLNQNVTPAAARV